MDLLIRGGTVVDGTGAPSVRADVAVRGDRIVAVGDLPDATAARVIDATGRVVCPGFIDVHVHSETALRGNGELRGSLLQGVTTHLTGPDGFGWAPLPGDASRDLWRSTSFAYGQPDLVPDWPTIDDYLAGFDGILGVNLVTMVPHQAVRFAVVGWDPRPATPTELDRMIGLTGDWMDAGAVGINTGLDYQPAASSDTAELIALSREVRRRGGIYAAHIRYAGIGRAEAYRETIRIGAESGIPVRLSHESADDETEPILEEALAAGVDLGIDWYVYPAGSSHLLVWLPPEDQVGGFDAVIERVRDPAHRKRIADFLHDRLTENAAEGGREYFSDTHSGQHIGRSIAEIAAERGRPLGETAVDLIVEESPEALLVFKRGLSEAAFEALARRTLKRPEFMVASDGIYHGARPHPRGYGCFARFLRLYVRELGAIGLEDAIHRMSGLVAQRFAIADRGRVEVGLAADLVVFDPDTVADRATWDEPRLTPLGIDAVIVNGLVAAESGQETGTLAGRVVRGNVPA